MEEKNLTWQNYFIIGGITDLPQLQAPIFFLVLFIYVTVLGANSTILLLICRNQQLHTPMYYFLSHLSIIDMCYSTVTMHKTLDVYVSKNKQISFSACLTQMYFYVTFLCCEFLILTAMSYDRYVAICIPLRYVMIMNKKLCAILTILCWIVAFLEVLPSVFIIYHIYCFNSNYINLFFCDLMSIMKLFCHGASLMEHLIYAESAFVGFLPFSFIIASYSYIIRAIFKISSSSGRWKAFYTCSSHITVVALLIVPTLCLYVRPTSAFALDSDKIFLLFYTSLTPLVNPLIYSLKNKDVKMAFWRLVEKKKKILV